MGSRSDRRLTGASRNEKKRRNTAGKATPKERNRRSMSSLPMTQLLLVATDDAKLTFLFLPRAIYRNDPLIFFPSLSCALNLFLAVYFLFIALRPFACLSFFCEGGTRLRAATSTRMTTERTSITARPPRLEGDKPVDQDCNARRAESTSNWRNCLVKRKPKACYSVGSDRPYREASPGLHKTVHCR